MRRILLILFLCSFLSSFPAFCEEVEVASEIITVDPDGEFFIIRHGRDAGIVMGNGFIVHRSGEKIAEAHIIEVRPTVSAAEILRTIDDYQIREGDSVLLVKRPSQARRDYIVRPAVSEKGDTFSLNIHSESKKVFTYAVLALQENGFSVISSSRTAGTILAKKPIALSILKELWADAVAAIDHNLVATFEIKAAGDLSSLSVSSFKEHSQKEKHVKRSVTRNSKYYNELIEVVSEIKKRAE